MKTSSLKIVIRAGGNGKRLFPLSNEKVPKQFLPLIDNDPMVLTTYKRLINFFDKDDIYISTSVVYQNLLKEIFPNVNNKQFIFEPYTKDTAAAEGLAALIIHKDNPDATILSMASDQYIEDPIGFASAIKISDKIINKYPNYLLLFGIKPSYPETNYCYLKKSEKIYAEDELKAYFVEQAIEKPDLDEAIEFIKNNCLWGIDIFVYKPKTLLNLFQRHQKDLFSKLEQIKGILNSTHNHNLIASIYKNIKTISLDYAIVEKTKKLITLELDMEWSDIGTWSNLAKLFKPSSNNNILINSSDHVTITDSNNLVILIKNHLKPVKIIGIDDAIIIDSDEGLLICNKSQEHKIKKLVKSDGHNK